jgi:Coenzyme PQQ synthesis protein D (PqqD)
MNAKTIYTARRRNLVEQQSDTECLIYDLQTNKMYCLNETATRIYHLCDGTNSVSKITAKLSKEFKSPINEHFIRLALEQLKKNNLLENNDDVSIDFGNLSRRAVIRKIGLATAVALPVISSVIAPLAASASSTCATTNRDLGCPCTQNSQCAPTSGGNGCCENVISSDRTCVARGGKEDGRFCGNNCECQTNYCDGTTRSCAPFPTGV